MSYKPKKLVSVRLEENYIKVIDEWAKGVSWRKRSEMIDAAVSFAAWMIKNGYATKLLHFYPEYDTVDKFEFEYHRDVKKEVY